MNRYQHLLLAGDSMIEFFNWQERFPALNIDNFGRSGETVGELERRAKKIVKQSRSPDLVLVMIGTNDVAMENFSFLPEYERILNTFSGAWHDATLVVNSLLPMELGYLAPDAVQRVNRLLNDLAGRWDASYLDVWAAMTDKSTMPLPGILEDEVHLSRKGYEIWSRVLEKFLSH